MADIPEVNKMLMEATKSIDKLKESHNQSDKLLGEALSDLMFYLREEFKELKKSK